MRIWRNMGLKTVCGLTVAVAVSAATTQLFAPPAFADDAQESVPAGDAARNKTDYWIGVRCVEVPELLRSQLDLEEGQGVLVDDVVADSPAERAGLKAHDVIAAVDGKPMNDPRTLAEAVSRAGDHDLKIEYLRAGHKQTLTVKPAPRPDSPASQRQDQRALREWVERLGRGPAPMRFRMWHPGMVLAPGASMFAPALPDDMTLTIEKQGGKPAKVTVKQGDKEWQAGEDALDKLPEQARDYAEHLFGSSGGMFPPGPANVAPHRGPPEQFGADGRFDRRLEEMSRELQELRRAFEKLQGKPSNP